MHPWGISRAWISETRTHSEIPLARRGGSDLKKSSPSECPLGRWESEPHMSSGSACIRAESEVG